MTAGRGVSATLVAGALAASAVAACTPDEAVDRGTCTAATCASGAFVWAAPATSAVESTVTAVATSPGEPPWFAGSYSQQLTIADRDVGDDSAGTLDGFAARIGARDLPSPWLAPILASYPQRVVGLVPDGEEGAIAVVTGRQEDSQVRVEAVWWTRSYIDDPLQEVQVARRATIAMMAAASGPAGGAVAAVDRVGWPLVAVSGVDVGLDGNTHLGARTLLFRIVQGLERELLFEQPAAQILDIAVVGDTIVIGGSYGNSPEGWPACPEVSCGFVAALDAAVPMGPPRWVRTVRASGGAAVASVAIGPTGRVVALATATGTPIEPLVAATPVPAFLVLLDAAGGDEAQRGLAEDGTEIASGDLAVGGDGGMIVALTFRGTVLIGPAPITSDVAQGDHEGVIGELAPQLTWRWADRLRGDGTVEINALALEGDQLALGGHYRGSLELFGAAVVAPATASPGNGFVLELVR